MFRSSFGTRPHQVCPGSRRQVGTSLARVHSDGQAPSAWSVTVSPYEFSDSGQNYAQPPAPLVTEPYGGAPTPESAPASSITGGSARRNQAAFIGAGLVLGFVLLLIMPVPGPRCGADQTRRRRLRQLPRLRRPARLALSSNSYTEIFKHFEGGDLRNVGIDDAKRAVPSTLRCSSRQSSESCFWRGPACSTFGNGGPCKK